MKIALDYACRWCKGEIAYFRKDGIRRGNLPKCCSARCKHQWDYSQRVLREGVKIPKKVCLCFVCGVEIVTNRETQIYCSPVCRRIMQSRRNKQKLAELHGARIFVYVCDFCGLDIVRETALGGVKKLHPECSVENRKAKDRAKSIRRAGLSIRSAVSLVKVVERDGWICWLCTEPVDSSIPRTHRLGATVDHVIPLFHGGTDDLDNLRLAHKSCNSSKGKKLLNAESA